MSCAQVSTFDSVIAAAAMSFGVDPALLKAHVANESSFNPRAIKAEPQIGDASYGLAQLLYRTAAGLGFPGAAPTDADRANLTGLYDPGTNLYLAAKLIAQNLATANGNADIAISAYNAGFSSVRPGDAKRNADGTIINQAYVNRVRACWQVYANEFANSVGPPDPTPNPPQAVAEAPPDTASRGALMGYSPAVWGLLLAALLGLVYYLQQRRNR